MWTCERRSDDSDHGLRLLVREVAPGPDVGFCFSHVSPGSAGTGHGHHSYMSCSMASTNLMSCWVYFYKVKSRVAFVELQQGKVHVASVTEVVGGEGRGSMTSNPPSLL